MTLNWNQIDRSQQQERRKWSKMMYSWLFFFVLPPFNWDLGNRLKRGRLDRKGEWEWKTHAPFLVPPFPLFVDFFLFLFAGFSISISNNVTKSLLLPSFLCLNRDFRCFIVVIVSHFVLILVVFGNYTWM